MAPIPDQADAPTRQLRQALKGLRAVIEQVHRVIGVLDDDQYTHRPVGVYDSSIGGHVRHCVDHLAALINAAGEGRIDYEHRQRGTPVETDRQTALDALDDGLGGLDQLAEYPPDHRLRTVAIISGDGAEVEAESTLLREVVFVLSHTVHHNAIIGAMIKTLGGEPPEHFGYAPATLSHLNG